MVGTESGNAFRTEKWVSGDDSLGWMNSITKELLPLEDPGCPRLDVDGQLFTRYPCVARVAPGQGFDFYLRLTNAGTNPATEVRLVDVFPAPGDRGVFVDDERGTEWEQAPTLLGPVELAGTGELDGSYTTGAPPVCTDDLETQPSACDAADWSADYDPAATAFRAFVTFPAADLLAPGGRAPRYDSGWPRRPRRRTPSRTRSPGTLSRTPTSSWTTARSCSCRKPSRSRPGWRWSTAGSACTKAVVGEPTAEQAGPYGFEYECLVTPEVAAGDPAADPVIAAAGTAELTAGQTLDIAGVPARANVLVWEPESERTDQ